MDQTIGAGNAARASGAYSVPGTQQNGIPQTQTPEGTRPESFLDAVAQTLQNEAVTGAAGINSLGGYGGLAGMGGLGSLGGFMGTASLSAAYYSMLTGRSAPAAAPAAGTVKSGSAAEGIGAAGNAGVAAGVGAVGNAGAAAGVDAANSAGAAGAISPEAALKAKYPGLVYHVFDASSGYWKTRNDYPHYLLYQEGDAAKEAMENWKPSGPNPFYGSIDGRFIAPKEIHALGSVPPGSKAVVIHPKVQQRMEQDPEYAAAILAKIDAWFAFDVARNEAIMPGSTWDMAQAVAIGEDGNICNACSSTANGEITCSQSGPDDEESWWDRRSARHAKFMKRMVQSQLEYRQQASDFAAAAAAKARLAAMMNNTDLKAIFGSEIAGVPTDEILALTQTQVWGSGTV